MSGVRIYKAHNRLAESVDVRFGLRLDAALSRAQDAVIDAREGMLASLRDWIDEVEALCDQPAPDRARLAWLANGVHGVAGACELGNLSRCGALLARALDLMGEGWRGDIAMVYVTALGRMLEGTDSPVQEAAVLSSLDTMNQRLFPET